MNGHVDEHQRALLDVEIRSQASADPTSLAVWIDTAFNGFFVFPREVIEYLRLHQAAATDAVLADGQIVTLESYICYVEWFGETIGAQVIANDGRMPLIGTELLHPHRLVVDYSTASVMVT